MWTFASFSTVMAVALTVGAGASGVNGEALARLGWMVISEFLHGQSSRGFPRKRRPQRPHHQSLIH